jgi:putative addiction module component (TIGR02574 family)
MATIDIAGLSLEERLRPLDELGESLSRTPEAIPMTPAQREELDRRLDELDREGPIGNPWGACGQNGVMHTDLSSKLLKTK